MSQRQFRPTTSGVRGMTVSDFSELTGRRNKPHRPLVKGLPDKGGRNNYGRVAVRFKGGGHKRRYRAIDFRRDKLNVPAQVVSIEYDPNRTSHIALLHYRDGEKRYILAPVGLEKGQLVFAGDEADIKPGNSLPLAKIPMGTFVHCIEMQPGRGAQLARSAGGQAQLMARENNYVLLRLPSGELRRLREECRATIGQVGNIDQINISIGKAGRSRWLGRRPHNRGVTMNPVDHPHGGGEGKTSGGRHPVTPWGQPTRGYKTRRGRYSDKYIVQRRSKKKG